MKPKLGSENGKVSHPVSKPIQRKAMNTHKEHIKKEPKHVFREEEDVGITRSSTLLTVRTILEDAQVILKSELEITTRNALKDVAKKIDEALELL